VGFNPSDFATDRLARQRTLGLMWMRTLARY
jgi:hypothetical protein